MRETNKFIRRQEANRRKRSHLEPKIHKPYSTKKSKYKKQELEAAYTQAN